MVYIFKGLGNKLMIIFLGWFVFILFYFEMIWSLMFFIGFKGKFLMY